MIWGNKKKELKEESVSKRPISIVFVVITVVSFLLFLLISVSVASTEHSFNYVQAISLTFIVFSSIYIIAFFFLILVNRKVNRKRMKNFLIALGVAVVLLTIFSTLQSISGKPYQSSEKIEEQRNDPPVADAGEDIKCNVGDVITLVGSNSRDPNGDKLSYVWNFGGDEFSGETLSLEFNEPKTYAISLTVSDGKASDSDIVQVIVDKQEKIAEEVEDEAIEEIPEVEVSEEEEITEEEEPEPEETVEEEPEPEQTVEEEPIVEEKPDEATLGEKNAAKKALDYLAYMPFSYSGLVDQLKFEGYTHEEAVYGVDRCGADWNEQAALKAQDYLNYSSFSRVELIAQLEFEGFTRQQAEYGVQAVGY